MKPEFQNGLAMPVFPFTPGTTGKEYNPHTSQIVRFCVWVEGDYDADQDGKRDLVKAVVQIPRACAEGSYKAPVIYEARPYSAGMFENTYEHIKKVAAGDYPPFDWNRLRKLQSEELPSPEVKTIGPLQASYEANPADWYYQDPGITSKTMMCYQNLDAYDDFLIRGFAIVLSSGYGSRGSDGFVQTGSDYERDGFTYIIDWLCSRRTGYANRDRTKAIRADWSNGNVGMTGISYAGTMPFAVATSGVEGLKTIVPLAGIADWYSFVNQQGSQRYWPKENLQSYLAYLVSGRYVDPRSTDADRYDIDTFQYAYAMAQMKDGFDYGPFWVEGNYTRNFKQLKCPALIVHGLNDENVSTKQFDLMRGAFEKAGQEVHLLLHQGPHMMPYLPGVHQEIRINNKHYEDILNAWFSHWLFGIENNAEKMPAVLVQDNTDQTAWHAYDFWSVNNTCTLQAQDEAEVCSALAENNITRENYDEIFCTKETPAHARWISEPCKEDTVLQGSVCVSFQACLSSGNPDTQFEAKNCNDADDPQYKLGLQANRMDDLKVFWLLADLADEPFESIACTDPMRTILNRHIVQKGTWNPGQGLTPGDEVEFDTVNRTWKIIARGQEDLCNPASGYDPVSSTAHINLNIGEYHSYQCYLNPTVYTVKKGHRLALVLTLEDPAMCLLHKTYSVHVHSAKAVLPVHNASETMLLTGRK